MPQATLVSYRFGGADGVSIESAKWAAALERLGWAVRTVAGAGQTDLLVPGLGLEDVEPPEDAAVEAALAGADLVVVENLCSLPLNPGASRVVAAALRGRPAVLHHHDLPWQRDRFARADLTIPDDRAWRHVTINDLSRRQLAERGITSTTIRNAFDTDATPGDRRSTRETLGLDDDARLVLQPTRAIARKNIPAAVALAEALGATYWLLGAAEEGYENDLAAILATARHRGVRCVHGPAGTGADQLVADAYAAADLVAFPSSWEGFGNPVVESAIHGRPLAIRRYPVAAELAGFGFRWLDAADHGAVQNWMAQPDPELLEHNRGVARRWFSFDALDTALGALLDDVVPGWRR